MVTTTTIHTETTVDTGTKRESRLGTLLFSTTHSAGPTILRLTAAVAMFPHGAQKLLGWWGGHGFQATMENMTKQGLPAVVVYFVVFTEFFGALMMLLGLCTRLVAVCYVALMVGAIATVHGKFGFFMNWFGQQAGEGFEYHLLVIGIALALLVMGGGKLSADRAIARRAAESTSAVR